MLKRTRPILLIASLALLVAAPIAAAKKTYKYSSTVTSAPVSTTNGYPNVGGSAVLVGSLTSTPFGPGTVIDHVTVTGQPQANVFTFKGTEVDMFADGTAGNTLTGTATVQSRRQPGDRHPRPPHTGPQPRPQPGAVRTRVNRPLQGRHR